MTGTLIASDLAGVATQKASGARPSLNGSKHLWAVVPVRVALHQPSETVPGHRPRYGHRSGGSLLFEASFDGRCPGHYFDCDGTILACFDPRADSDNFDLGLNPDQLYIAVNDLERVFESAEELNAEVPSTPSPPDPGASAPST